MLGWKPLRPGDSGEMPRSRREPQKTNIRLSPKVRTSTSLISECFPAATAGSASTAFPIRYHSPEEVASCFRPEAHTRCETIHALARAAFVKSHRKKVAR